MGFTRIPYVLCFLFLFKVYTDFLFCLSFSYFLHNKYSHIPRIFTYLTEIMYIKYHHVLWSNSNSFLGKHQILILDICRGSIQHNCNPVDLSKLCKTFTNFIFERKFKKSLFHAGENIELSAYQWLRNVKLRG